MANEIQSQVKVSKKSRFSAIWIIPIVALLIGIYLIYNNYENKGLTIQILLDSGYGLEAGKTKIKYKGVAIGEVTDINLNRNDKMVVATALIDKEESYLIVEGTEFWVVKPRVSGGKITGLSTIISGDYIQIKPGTGNKKTEFVALEEPPVGDSSLPGLYINLISDNLGSLQPGSPIYYKKVKVGEIYDHKLKDDNKIHFRAFIDEEYQNLVNDKTRFWNVSGISVETGLAGVKIQSESLASILEGGVAFDNPDELPGNQAQNDAEFLIYKDHQSAMRKEGGLNIVFRVDKLGSLKAGAPILYKELKVGEIEGHKLTPDEQHIDINAYIFREYAHLVKTNSRFWNVSGITVDAGLSGVKIHSETLTTILEGGVAFDNPSVQSGDPVENGAVFTLYEDQKSAVKTGGLNIVVRVDKLGSLKTSAPILYKELKVGEIEGHKLTPDERNIDINTYIYRDYSHLVKTDSRFWNVSGIEIDTAISGVKIKTQSIQTIIDGGIAFSNPPDSQGSRAKQGTLYNLYNSYEDAFKPATQILITFKDSKGLSPGNPLKYKGVEVGVIESVELDDGMSGVLIKISLFGGGEKFAKSGSMFWVAEPEIGLGGVKNVGAILVKYIDVIPGYGSETYEFTGLEQKPLIENADDNLHLILLSERLSSVSQGAPVYYKQIEVGKVTGHKLSDNAENVEIFIAINREYAPLVRSNSKFWNVSGIGVDFYLFGVKAKTESLSSLIKGGIAFATPEKELGEIVHNGSAFELFERPEKKWLKWKPIINFRDSYNNPESNTADY